MFGIYVEKFMKDGFQCGTVLICYAREINDSTFHGLFSSIFSVTTNKERFKCKTKNL